MSTCRVSVVLVLVAACLGWPALAEAGCTVRGRVEYWDEIESRYKPASHVEVEVEADWWMSDPHVVTNSNGQYSVTVRNPHWGDFDDVDIEVYAETPGHIQVFNWILAWYAYRVTSREFDNLKANQTMTLNMRIGGPQQYNVGKIHYRNAADTAKAYLVHQEMYKHYSTLRAKGWPNSAFREKEAIVPAAFGEYYYNHFTGYINLGTDGFTGTGPWPPLDKANHPNVAFNSFRKTVRHEYSHAIHDDLTLIAPLGLNMPARHWPTKETNRFLAYTEGWADFLPLATIGRLDHRWEFSGGPRALTFPAGDHWAMEGECTGLLWDIHDPKGYEPVRNPAAKTADGKHNVPGDAVGKQVWWDDMHDPKLSRIQYIASRFGPGAGLVVSCQTIREFIKTYRRYYPGPGHDLKSVAFNRGITDHLPPEHAAVLAGNSSVRRHGRRVTIACTVHEQDAEDRPWVRLSAYHQLSGGTIVPVVANSRLSSGWAGANRSVSLSFNLAPGYKTGDALWLEVNDDMLPRVYRFAVPVKDDAVVVAVIPGHPGLITIPGRKIPGTFLRLAYTEDFEKKTLKNWAFVNPLGPGAGPAVVRAEHGNRLLTTGGLSDAVWTIASFQDYTLQFRYRHAKGNGRVTLCRPGAVLPPLPWASLLNLTMSDTTASLGWGRMKTGIQPMKKAAYAFRPGQWYDMTVKKYGQRIQISVGGKLVIDASHRLLGAKGFVSFGSLGGGWHAYDNIRLTPGAAAPATAVLIAKPPLVLGKIRPPLVAPKPLNRADVQNIQRMRQLIRQARRELRAHAEREELKERQERGLYKLAQVRGDLRVRTQPRALFHIARTERALPTARLAPAQAADRQAFEGWLGERVRGRAIARPLAAAEKAVVRERLKVIDASIAQHQLAARRVPALSQTLAQTFRALKFDPKGNPNMQKQAQRAAQGLQQQLRRITSDKQLVPRLHVHRQALATLAR